ncbi:sigma 54-interacting transcriptional regulator [Pseudalkalibacillus caeni]|uniref:HTH-type transcriptional regulatory protein TyrR n=1 Tax=Exobacillus caeni TaxID=2574798 RepID=A0A5R9F6R8_9BACL|nr:sigma 54-interacting transcriptional regulator [Pseudalkalibacillus caeni]TLS36523.1 PAS domain S-box protein [Pseudalkalibacillus caeni]
MLNLLDTVQDAISLFSSTGKNSLEVQNSEGEVVGFFMLSDLNDAIQQGKLNEPIEAIMKGRTRNEHAVPPMQAINEEEYSKLINSNVFLDIINSLYDGVYITDHNGITVQINRAYERITGIKAEEVVGYHMDELVESGLISRSVSIEVLKEKRQVTLMQTIKDKRRVIVSGTPIYGEEGKILYVISSVRDITELLHLKHEIDELQSLKKLRQSTGSMHENTYDEILHSVIISEETKELYKLAERVARTDVKVLLQGETGVGKTLVAKFIHEKSNRTDEAFLELNCGALPSNLIEAELFGYEAGAFTGASTKGKKGLLELADEGTLFLDEIGDLPIEVQVKLLKVVEENKFMPLGSTEVKTVDVRIIAASHKNLKQMVDKGQFREDLFYRLSVVPVTIPPLRQRKRELIPLIHYYMDRFNARYNIDKELTIEAIDALTEYRWPGNIRELINVIERLVVTSTTDQIDLEHLPDSIRLSSYPRDLDVNGIIPLKDATEKIERQLITKALKQYKTTRKAAEVLQVSQSTIVQKMKKWNISD